ncbi:hypothetical protein ITP53_01995 [Nonomuraea sp. K274]|uniref:Uncharacterized protein n=1 Tax=Nonomuraea cypriaca TaxID=1187855 RepID=A0A931EXT9_9ACTN|nr:hypothetical protein [Nonomuraea cypriaca]MBF8184536.1 hypothetical protein [Nonomuraea cypriaca]
MTSSEGMGRQQRVRLHGGRSWGLKALIGCSSVLVLFLLLVMGWIATILSGWLAAVLGILCAGVALLCVASLGFLLLDILRAAAWLDGTVLVVRSAFTTRRCDLAEAALITIDSVVERSFAGNAGSAPTGRLIPRLRVQDPRTGHVVSLQLDDPATRSLFSPVRLHALADAILAGHRPEPYARAAWQAAQEFRRLAADPFAAHR